MRCGPIAASLLLHTALIGGGIALGCTAHAFRLQVRWQPSQASQPSTVRLDAPQLPPVEPEDLPPPAVEPEAPSTPPPETALVAPSPWFAAEPRAAERIEAAPQRLQPPPDWLSRVRPVAAAAAPPPAPAADFVDAVPDDSKNQPPPYPLESRRRKEQGVVRLELQIDVDGAVTDAQVLASSGHLRLDRAARTALRQWRFHPARRGGVAVPTCIEQTVEFQLTKVAAAN